jgi:hypothetical protein
VRGRRRVERHAVALTGRRLVFRRFAGAVDTRRVWPVLVAPDFAAFVTHRHQQAGNVPTGFGDPESLKSDLDVDSHVAASSSVLGSDSGLFQHCLVLWKQPGAVFGHDAPPLRYALELINALHCSLNDHDESSNGSRSLMLTTAP